jgi:hypothetical protein
VGIASILAAFQTSSNPSDSFWKAIFMVLLGVFISMCGILWREVTRHFKTQDDTILKLSDHIDDELKAIRGKQERMLGLMLAMVMFAKTEGQDISTMVNAIQSVMER